VMHRTATWSAGEKEEEMEGRGNGRWTHAVAQHGSGMICGVVGGPRYLTPRIRRGGLIHPPGWPAASHLHACAYKVLPLDSTLHTSRCPSFCLALRRSVWRTRAHLSLAR
jgi:hypothetical protein